MAKKRVYAYYDGSNFYHGLKGSYGVTSIDFFHMTTQLLELEKEELIRIKYFNSPVNQEEDPKAYVKQQRFFAGLRRTPLVEVLLGRLVRRPLKKIRVECDNGCGAQQAEYVICPKCQNNIEIVQCSKSMEKGIDVKLAINMLTDALNDKYDVALLFSGDADFCPAVKYIVKTVKKEVVYCHFPQPKTGELLQTASSSRLITIDAVNNALSTNSSNRPSLTK